MNTSRATTQELIAAGIITPETAEFIEDYAQYIDTHGDVPPATSIEVREVGRPKLFDEDLVHMNTRITLSQRDFIDRYARKTGHTRADIVRAAIDMYRDAHTKELASN